MYFSIAAPQVITLPDGTQLSFRVNPADTSLVEMHIVGVDGNDVPGTHVLTFKRNGGPNDTAFVPTAQINEQPKYKSVDDDAVRGDDWKTKEINHTAQDAPLAGDTFAPSRNPATKSAGQPDAKPLGGEKIDPVHGKITTAGTDAQAGKPREARPEDASRADLAERAGVGIPPTDPALFGKANPDRGYDTPVDTKPAA